MDKNEIWNLTLQELEVTLSRASFTTWFKDTYISYLSEEEIIIGVSSNFTKEWLSNKYKKQIFDGLKKFVPRLKKIEFEITKKKPEEETITQKTIPEPVKVERNTRKSLDPKQTFDNFVVGESNKLAHAASLAVAKKPGLVYNPLFLYGDVGLGKTHLMQAAGNEILRRNPQKKVLYIPCEQFANEFIRNIRSGSMDKFKKTYREIDALLVDDVHFLAGKEGTQEEFFHTFNSLHQNSKQIIISSDRPPKDISLLEKRLKSRFEWGMIADIGRPDLETRLAILSSKAKEKGIKLEPKIINFVAQNIQDNIRELEGALNKIAALASISGEKPDLKLAEKVLEGFRKKEGVNISPEKTLEEVATFYQIKKSDLLSPKRNKDIALPRQIAMYILRYELNLSFPKIASLLKKKDHTTIIHGCNKIEKIIGVDGSLRKDIAFLKEKIHI